MLRATKDSADGLVGYDEAVPCLRLRVQFPLGVGLGKVVSPRVFHQSPRSCCLF